MTIAELWQDVKDLTAAFRSGDWGTFIRGAADIFSEFAGLFGLKVFNAGPDDDAHLDACVTECEKLKADMDSGKMPKSAGGPDEKSLDPATITLLVTLVIQVLKQLREWRKKPTT